MCIRDSINVTDAISRLATADGIDIKGLVKSEDEMQAEMQQAQAQQYAQNVDPQQAVELAQQYLPQQQQG